MPQRAPPAVARPAAADLACRLSDLPGKICYDFRRILAHVNASATATTPQPPIAALPNWLRWAALAWIVVWFPAYWRAWGLANFLHLCDLAVILTCIGLWTDSRLLISSQAVSALLVDITWALDAAWALVGKHHLIGGTEYLFDSSVALWIRLLSLFHIVLPLFLLLALWRMGYDRRAWVLQTAVALAVFIACRFTNPATNINYAFRDPFFHRAWGPAPAHVAVSVAFLAFVPYLPTHLLLARLFRSAHSPARISSRESARASTPPAAHP